MTEKKIVSVDLNAAKTKAKKAAKGAASTFSERVSAARTTATAHAKAQREKVVALVLAKGIELSKKQLAALEKLRKKLR